MPPQPRRKRPGLRPGREVSNFLPRVLTCIAVVSVIVSITLLTALETHQQQQASKQESFPDQQQQQVEQNRQAAQAEHQPVSGKDFASSVEAAISFLVDLARLPLQDLLKRVNEQDVFHLSKLINSTTCPFTNTNSLPDWYVPPASPKKDFLNTPKMLLWYEHLSKAGGTTFCKLAQKNMAKEQVPHYYCMPPDGKEIDGRVGRWSNDKLLGYMDKNPAIRIVSNEWNPFPPQRWDIADEQLLLVTTLRDPMDRLLSAFHFWGVLHNPLEIKPTFAQWLHRKFLIAERSEPYDMSIATQVGRYNFMTWKFSRGTMPQAPDGAGDKDAFPAHVTPEQEQQWLRPFTEAIQTLTKFDLVFILELIGDYPQPLKERLGWTKLQENHVVPSGKIENNHADATMTAQEFEELWDANRFDMILYMWMKALYLTNFQCGSL